MNNKELLGLIEDVKNICINMATGGEFDYEKYESARERILSRSELKSVLPDWLIENRYGSQFWNFIKAKFGHYAERRVFIKSSFDEVTDYVNSGGSQPVASTLVLTIEELDSDQITRLWRKSLERLQNDPEGAVTSAKSLLEATIKHILDREGIVYTKNDDLLDLYKKVRTKLNLDPANHNVETFKQLLSGVTSVITGFSALRNEYGDAHGKGLNAFQVETRHAELAINLSGSLCAFLLKTYQRTMISK